MSQINDAVVVRRNYPEWLIVCVVAVTGDGRAVVEHPGTLQIEDEPGKWEVVGRFKQKPRTFMNWLFNDRIEWEFIPDDTPPQHNGTSTC